MPKSIKAIERTSIHRITSGQVVVDLQTAVKELLENSVDAGATTIDVRFKQFGLNGIEVVDNGHGIPEADYDSIGLQHHTSKLESFSDLMSVSTFGFRGEALSSLCALSEEVCVTTATSSTTPMGVTLVMDPSGKVSKRSTVARQPGTTVFVKNLFSSLPVRKKEFERNVKREFGKALSLLTAYALGPCAAGSGIRLTVTNQPEKGPKTTQIKTLGSPSSRASVTALWGPKALENIIDMDVNFEVDKQKANLKRLQSQDFTPTLVKVKGLISKFAVGSGRNGTDRQFFFVNGRPCNMPKVQKTFNEVYHSFNANQAPFIIADIILPTDAYDVNVSPDKRTILLHNEANLLMQLKVALEAYFSPSRATYDLGGSHQAKISTQTLFSQGLRTLKMQATPFHEPPGDVDDAVRQPGWPSASSPHPLTNTLHSATTPVASFTSGRSSPLSSSVLSPSGSDEMAISRTEPDDPSSPEDPVDVSRVEPFSKPPTSVIFDTSDTVWGRHLGIGRPEFLPPKDNSLSASCSSETREPPKVETRPAKMRRKSDDLDGENDEIAAEVDTELSKTHNVLSSKPTAFKKITKPGSSSLHISHNSVHPRSSLRKQLASFIQSGSRLSASASTSGLETREMVAEVEEGDDENQGKDREAPVQVHEDELDRDEDALLTSDTPTSPEPSRRGRHSASSHLRVPSVGQPNQLAGPKESYLNDDDDNMEDLSSVLNQARASSSTTPSAASQKDQAFHPEIIRSDKLGADITLRLDLEKVKQNISRKLNARRSFSVEASATDAGDGSVSIDAGVSNTDDDDKAMNALARVIDKKDFAEMNVIGQFNLGFIVVRRRGNSMDDLFIVDQHAADEKYNFEALQETTKLESQKLFRPQPLEITAADEMVALDNLEVLRQNGFEIDVDENASIGQGRRLQVTSLPVSKSTVFDLKDLEEILHLLRDLPAGQVVRCSKARAMFAMRACRKSVMVGMPLTHPQMTTVVRHMGTMDQPWNCPHGRPTMRHLTDIKISGLRARDKIDWSTLS